MRGGRSSFAIAFIRDEAGVLTFLSLIFFVMLMAAGGLSIDLGRLYGERGQMQAFVDSAALSAASQLDYQTGALDRAARAAIGETVNSTTVGPLITGSENFSTTPGNMEIQSVAFLDSLDSTWVPPDAMPYGTDHVLCTYEDSAFTCSGGTTEADAESTAQFVEVTAAPRTVSYLLLPLVDFIGKLFGASSTVSSQLLALQAAAGFKKEVCDLNPVMICNPDEPSTNTDTLYPYAPQVGEQVLMKSSKTNAAWVPGDFGLLQPAADAGGSCNGNPHGAGYITCILALIDPLTQCTSGTIQVKPGQAEVTSSGFNVRFDMYPPGNGPNSFRGNPALFGPSVNVTKGIVGSGSCPNANSGNSFNAAPNTVPFPRDTNIQADTTGTVRFGNATWNAQAYWSANHSASDPYPFNTSVSPPTRYDMYMCENGHSNQIVVGTPLTGRCNAQDIPNKTPPASNENGNPTCVTTNKVDNPVRDRRTLTMAVVNCHAAGLSGNSSSVGPNIPVVAYLKMFLTEPVGLQENTSGKVTGYSSNSNNVYAEIAGIVKPGDDTGVLHVNPVLYR